MQKLRYKFLLIAPVYIFLFAGLGCDSYFKEKSKTKVVVSKVNEDLEKVTLRLLEKRNFNKEIISQGKIRTQFRSEVSFDLEEKIVSIYIKTGQYVKKGQILAELEKFNYQLQIDKVNHQIKQAEFKIEEKLISLGYDPKQATIAEDLKKRLAIEFNLENLKTEKKLALYNLEKTKIKAPISGIIANVEAQTGNLSSNYKKLCTIIDNRHFEVTFPILESELSFVKTNMSLQILTLSQKEKNYKGKIKAINPEVDEYGMLTIIGSVSNNYQSLFEGMQVQVYLQKKVLNQLVVPKESVVDRQGKQVIFTYKNGLAHWNYVQIDQENAEYYTIKDGLVEGDTIVLDNNLYLAHLEKVIGSFEKHQK